jgi:hypothetical protein
MALGLLTQVTEQIRKAATTKPADPNKTATEPNDNPIRAGQAKDLLAERLLCGSTTCRIQRIFLSRVDKSEQNRCTI